MLPEPVAKHTECICLACRSVTVIRSSSIDVHIRCERGMPPTGMSTLDINNEEREDGNASLQKAKQIPLNELIMSLQKYVVVCTLILLVSFSIAAVPGVVDVTLSAEPSTVTVGDTFYLVVTFGPVDRQHYSALARFTLPTGSPLRFNDNYASLGGLDTLRGNGNIFSSLTTNQLISDTWVLSGVSGTPISSVADRNILGKIPMVALSTGTVDNTQISLQSSEIVRTVNPFDGDTVYTASYSLTPFTIQSSASDTGGCIPRAATCDQPGINCPGSVVTPAIGCSLPGQRCNSNTHACEAISTTSCNADADCSGELKCIRGQCSDLMTRIRTILESTRYNSLQKVSLIARMLRLNAGT